MNWNRLLRARPTPASGALLFVLLAMWYAASSQNNAAAYLLFFVLGSVFVVSIPHTLLNVGDLKARAESIKPVFAGDEASLPVELMNESRRTRHAICVGVAGSGDDDERVDEIASGKAARVIVRFPAPARGQHEVESLCLTSTYPLGFLRAAKWIGLGQRYVVYPRPDGDRNLPIHHTRSKHNRPQTEIREGDDFAGLRAYVPGESQRHIDWKAVGRGQPLMTKQYSTEGGGVLYLDFAAPPLGDTEARLAQLALWVIEAERARRPYALRLPGTEIAVSLGDAHFHRCLRALALYK